MCETWEPRMVHECAECGVAEGQFHRKGCLWDDCNRCGGQYVTCPCPPHRKRRTRFILWLHMCGRCGEAAPKQFWASRKDWEATVQCGERHQVLCLKCFAFLRHIQGLPPASVQWTPEFTTAAEGLARCRGISVEEAQAELDEMEQRFASQHAYLSNVLHFFSLTHPHGQRSRGGWSVWAGRASRRVALLRRCHAHL